MVFKQKKGLGLSEREFEMGSVIFASFIENIKYHFQCFYQSLHTSDSRKYHMLATHVPTTKKEIFQKV